MPSLQALPLELFHQIVDVLVEVDIDGAINLLQTCKGYSLSTGYDRIRYLSLWKKSGFPRRNKVPRHIRQEANLLQARRWPHFAQHIGEHRKEFKWNRIPATVQENGTQIELSRAARIIGDWIYDVSKDRLSLYCFEISPIGSGSDCLMGPLKVSLNGPILSYDVDREQGTLAVLAQSAEGLRLTVHDHSLPAFNILSQVIVDAMDQQYNFAEVSLNGSSVLLSLDNKMQVYDWRTNTEPKQIWSRTCERTTSAGWYIRANLLSAQVVACIVLETYRTIGSMRVRRGTVELYRMDQYVPRVADIILSEAHIDAMQPRILQDPYRYISFEVGGKNALEECLRNRYDGPILLQTFSDTRVGEISALCNVLYPKAALALYSDDPSKPSYPILGGEWLRSNFPIVRGASPLQSGIHGNKVISTAKQGRCELIYWNYEQQDSTAESLQVSAVEKIRPLLSSLSEGLDDRFHNDYVSLDGPRVLFTCFKCVELHNGTVTTTEPLCSFWGTLEPNSP